MKTKKIKSPGDNYVEKNEKYNKKRVKKEEKGMDTAGIATELKENSSKRSYSKLPRLRGIKK